MSESISSISNSTGSMGSSIGTSNIVELTGNNNSISCFDGGYGGFNGLSGCGGSNANIINIDIDIGRRRRHRCC